jgi:hypothetical protein
MLTKSNNISMIENQYSKNFENNEKYNHYFLRLKNNYEYLRVYEVKFNNEIKPNSFISVNNEKK